MAACLLFAAGMPVHAAEQLDLDRTGSLTVQVHDGEKPVPGGELTIFPIGNIDTSTNPPRFVRNAVTKDSGISLDQVNDSTTAKAMLAWLKRNHISGNVSRVGSDATVTWKNLAVGLYLVEQNEAATGYHAMSPFLISIPNYSETRKTYLYDVSAYPKSDPSKLKLPSEEVDEPDTPVKPPTVHYEYEIPDYEYHYSTRKVPIYSIIDETPVGYEFNYPSLEQLAPETVPFTAYVPSTSAGMKMMEYAGILILSAFCFHLLRIRQTLYDSRLVQIDGSGQATASGKLEDELSKPE